GGREITSHWNQPCSGQRPACSSHGRSAVTAPSGMIWVFASSLLQTGQRSGVRRLDAMLILLLTVRLMPRRDAARSAAETGVATVSYHRPDWPPSRVAAISKRPYNAHRGT